MWFEKCPSHFKIILYCRCVTILSLFKKKKSHTNQFLEFINRQRYIKFTIKTEYYVKPPFFYLVIDKCNGFIIQFCVFCLISYCHFNFKINYVRTLMLKAFIYFMKLWLLSQSHSIFFKYFTENGYTHQLFEKLVNRLLSKKYQPKQCVP